MIHLPTAYELAQLEAFRQPHAVTIYIPAVDMDVITSHPHRIILKNLISEAATELYAEGVSKRDIERTLHPAKAILEDHEFWPIYREGLVIFLHPDLSMYFHIPYTSTTPRMTIGTGYDLGLLRDAIRSNQQYFVLTLSHHNIRLFEGDHYDLKPVHLKNLPNDLHETLHLDEPAKSRQTHTIAPAARGKGSEAFHQQYNVAETDKVMLEEFFRRIDRSLHRFLNIHHRPLVIAGTERLLSMYRQINTYPGLVKDSVPGNQENADIQALRKKAWRAVSKASA